MPESRRKTSEGRGVAGKAGVSGAEEREANRVRAVAAEGASAASASAGERSIVAPDSAMSPSPVEDLSDYLGGRKFGTILADPPWRFANRTGKVAPEHRRLSRYGTLSFDEIAALPVGGHAEDVSHCYLWVPNALLPHGLRILASWGFQYKTNLVWHKVRKDGGSDGRGVGFYFRNVTEIVLFGVRGKNARTLGPGRRQVNLIASRKREHSRKPDELYDLIESCSRGPYLELFGRGSRGNWTVWGNQADPDYRPDWPTYGYNSMVVSS